MEGKAGVREETVPNPRVAFHTYKKWAYLLDEVFNTSSPYWVWPPDDVL